MTRGSLDRGQNARKNKVTKKLRKSYVRGPGRSYEKRPESYRKVTKKLPPWPEFGPEESKSYPKVTKKLQKLSKSYEKVTKVMKTQHFWTWPLRGHVQKCKDLVTFVTFS